MKSGKDRKTVMVLEVQAKASLPIIQSCARHGLRVVAGAPKRYCTGFYSRAVRKRFIYPSPVKQPEACIQAILRFLERHEIEVLFPVGDVMTDLIACHQDEVRKHTRLVLVEYETFRKGRSKIDTLKAAAAAGVPIPGTWYPHERPIDEVAGEIRYPALIKPDIAAGARGMKRVESPDELKRWLPAIEKEFGRVFVQEFVPHTGMQYKSDVIISDDGELLAGVAYAKLRYYPPSGGSSVLNKTVDRPDILDNVTRVLRQLQWHGFCDFDFIEDPRDGVVKLMEINPRYPESFRATEAAGLDMPWMMYQLAVEGHCLPDRTLRTGRYLRFLVGDIMWFLTSPDRWKARPSFFRFFDRNTIYQVLSASDIGPFVGYVLENVLVMFDRKARRERMRLGGDSATDTPGTPEH